MKSMEIEEEPVQIKEDSDEDEVNALLWFFDSIEIFMKKRMN